MRRALAAAWLVFVWLALTAHVSPVNVLAGAALAIALLSFFRPATRSGRAGRLRPWHALRFLAFFGVKFVHANIQVARAVVRPTRVRDRRAVIAVAIAAPSDTTTTLLSMAVSLTPGTFILEMQRQPPVLFVHTLQIDTAKAARLEVLEMERRIVQAFGPAQATREVDALIEAVHAETEPWRT